MAITEQAAKNMMMLHCRGRFVEEDELRQVETPEATKSHVPVPHHHYLDLVRSTCPDYGLEIQNQVHALSETGDVYFGILNLGAASMPDGTGFVLGLRNSHDKSVATGLVSGTRVFVCDNLCFSGEFKICRKHTSRILHDLPQLVDKAVAGVEAMRVDEAERIDAYRNLQIEDRRHADHVMMQILRMGGMPASMVGKVDQAWAEPEHDEFKDRTLWSLYNAVTGVYAETGRSLDSTLQRGRWLTRACDKEAGLLKIREARETAHDAVILPG